MTRTAFLVGLCVLLLGGSVQAAVSTAAKQAQLKTLRTRIAKVQANLDRDIQTRGNVQQQLRDSEQQIAQLAGSLHGLDRSVAQAQLHLDALQREQTQKQAALDAQKDALAKQIRAAYMEGRDSQLQLLLNAQDPATIGRLLAYYDYFNKARAMRIRAVRVELEALAKINAQVQQQVLTLSGLRDQRAQALAKLEQSRKARKQALAQLSASIHTHGEQLARMKRDERSIEDLLANLQQTLADIPADLEGHHRFAGLRGRLPWPVAGRIIQRFGEALAGGRLRAQGDLIAAPLGTPVRAVSYGRVVFADWLPHFGLLVIIDHGDGYMSIYAHNQSVYAHVGDWVQMGETIATLGDSGGQNEPALYFEIRHRSVALSPRDWCRGYPRG
ncbi:MAG: peptidoglycan DD-metalloendopeptidase family protein [Gammaproteobacteria bacterium]